MNKIAALVASSLIAVGGAAFAQDNLPDPGHDAARQERMNDAYREHRDGSGARNDLHDAGHSFHQGLRSTGHAIDHGVHATGHAIHRGATNAGHAIRRTVNGTETPQHRATSTTTHP